MKQIFVVWFALFPVLANAEPANKLKLELRHNSTELKGRLFYSSDSFNDIAKAVIDKRLNILCGRGIFLLYEKANYIANDKNLGGVSLYASNTLSCTKLQVIGRLGSLQSVTGVEFSKAHITFFPYTNFMGIAMPVSPPYKKKLGNTPPTATSIVNSLITVGQYRWTVILADDTKLCITPQKSPTAICFLSNLVDNTNIMPISGVKMVRKHCPINETGMLTVQLTECQEMNAGLVTPLKPTMPFGSSKETPKEKVEDPKKCEIDDSNDILTPEQKDLIHARLNGSLVSGDFMQAIKNPKNIWKVEIFQKCFTIFLTVCNNEVIDTEYLLMFAALYFHHLDKAWENSTDVGTNTDDLVSESEWMEINDDLEKCSRGLQSNSPLEISSIVSHVFRSYEKYTEITDKVERVFGIRPNYDHIMEINWIMANTVAAVCLGVHKNKVNFYTRFWNIYHPLYFTPIEEQWKHPGDASIAYKFIFGGFGMEKSLDRIGMCGQAAILEGSYLTPYTRSIEQTQKVFVPK